MKKNEPRPLVQSVWVVVQENEGLITKPFTNQKAAVAFAKQLAGKCPSVRTEVARYLIALNSHKSFGARVNE